MKHFDDELSLEKYKVDLHSAAKNIGNQLLSDGEKAVKKAARYVLFMYTSLQVQLATGCRVKNARHVCGHA